MQSPLLVLHPKLIHVTGMKHQGCSMKTQGRGESDFFGKIFPYGFFKSLVLVISASQPYFLYMLISISKSRWRKQDFWFITCVFSSFKNFFFCRSFLYTVFVFPITLSWFIIRSEFIVTLLMIENIVECASLSDIIIFSLFAAATREGSSDSILSIVALFRLISPLDSSHLIRFSCFNKPYWE